MKCAQTWENTRKSGSQINHKCRSIQKAQLSEYVDHVCEPHSGWFTNLGYKLPKRDIPNFLGSYNTQPPWQATVYLSVSWCAVVCCSSAIKTIQNWCIFANILIFCLNKCYLFETQCICYFDRTVEKGNAGNSLFCCWSSSSFEGQWPPFDFPAPRVVGNIVETQEVFYFHDAK